MTKVKGTPHQLENAQRIRDFILAGQAKVTLVSQITKVRFTYKIEQADDKEGFFFVSLLTGQNNESDYSYMGVIQNNLFRTTKKSRFTPEAKSLQAFMFFFKNLVEKNCVHEKMEVWHEGSCCRCGRALTVPESIENGIGPECAKKVGLKAHYLGLNKVIPGDEGSTDLFMAG